MVVLYLEKHPGEQLQALCKEIDPDNWAALRARVRRTQEARKAALEAAPSRPSSILDEAGGATKRAARRVLRDPEARRQVIADLKTEELAELGREANEAAIDRHRAERDQGR